MTDITLSENSHGQTSTARRTATAVLVTAAALLAPFFLGADSASAKDLSLPYRDYPGFTCHAWNSKGECTDFSYFGTAPSYSAPHYSIPKYRSTSSRSYTNANRNCYDSYGRYNVNYCDDYTSNTYRGSVLHDNDCYDSRGRYDSRYCDDTDQYGDVTVRVTAAPNPVYENDLLTYSIYLRNDSSRDRTIDVHAFLDPETDFHSASDSGFAYRSDEARWDNVRIRARASETLSLTVRVPDNVRSNDTLRLRVEADGSTDDVVTDVRTGSSNRNCYDSLGRYDSRYCDDYYDNDRDCYDSYGRYNPRYCDDYYDDCRYTSSSSYCEDVTISARASVSDARVGELITYTIQLRNDDSRSRSIRVRATLDPDTTFYSASDSGRSFGRDQVEWDSITVGADSTRTFTVSARVDSSARYNDILSFIVEADGDEDDVTVRVR